jgi:hypothetical protein
MAMALKDYEKGIRDGMDGIYQPPHPGVPGSGRVYLSMKIEEDRDDYQFGYMIGRKQTLRNKPPVWTARTPEMGLRSR